MHYSKIQYNTLKPNPFQSQHSPFQRNNFYHNDLYTNNSYYQQKIKNDHRLDMTILNKPGFLIKQQSLYPENNHNQIEKALNYADHIVYTPKRKFYNQDAETERLVKYGTNPFLQKSTLFQSKLQYLKRSSKSKLSTNKSDLGIKSYKVLNGIDQLEQSQGNKIKTSKKIQENNVIIKNKNYNVAQSQKYQPNQQNQSNQSNLKNPKNQQIIQQDSSDEEMFYDTIPQMRNKSQNQKNKNFPNPFENQLVTKDIQQPKTIQFKSKIFTRII